ncbi:hypothetical protein CCR95_23750 [Thiocystis minor]|uniref:hypothetical protein n=1 Tax=Thiocystis minor TaxID=61597 RepID=UPI001912C128|nr:hypothetical protein [Thiocystis minor]MBK5966999.1 hypothetical protein [Thiocystis minor]
MGTPSSDHLPTDDTRCVLLWRPSFGVFRRGSPGLGISIDAVLRVFRVFRAGNERAVKGFGIPGRTAARFLFLLDLDA